MRYRIKELDGRFFPQYKYKYWPFWFYVRDYRGDIYNFEEKKYAKMAINNHKSQNRPVIKSKPIYHEVI